MSPKKKVTCPFCGEEIEAEALRCPKCGNSWDDAEEREAIRVMLSMPGMGEKRVKKLHDAGFRKIKDVEDADLEEILRKAGIPLKVAKEVKERVEEKKGIYICPNCGAFVGAEAKECPICGSPLEGEEEIEGEIEEKGVGGLKDDLFVEEVQNLYLCKICGAFVSENMDSCPVCGAKMPENRAEMPEVEDKYLEDEEKNIEAIKKFFGVEKIPESSIPAPDVLETTTELDICPNCGAFVRPEAEKCPICGASLLEDIPEEVKEKEEHDALLELEDLKDQLIGAEIPEIEDIEVSFICPECGAEVPEDSKVCPNCGAIFVDESEKKGEEHSILSLEDVIGQEAISDNKSEEEIKAEVDSLIIPENEGKPAENSKYVEEFELSLGLEGGLDDISSIDVSEKKSDKQIKIPSLDIPKKLKKREWGRLEDYIMAAASISVILLASEYLLTYPFVTQPKIAYGSSALSIFVSLSFISTLVLFLDRKEIFSRKIGSLFLIFPLIFVLFIPAHWYFDIVFERALLSDFIMAGLTALLSIGVLLIFRDDLHPFFVSYIGLIALALHSVLFISDFYASLPSYDYVPSYSMALFGGGMLSFGVYLRIDSAVRTILSTRDVLLGHKYYISGEYDKAMKYYTRAIGRKRGNEVGYDLAYYSKGTALLSAGNAIEALKYLNRAIKDNPNNEMAWNNRGIALANLGLDEAALKSYERATEINPEYEVAWNNMGNALARMGKYEEALKCYDRALRINPDYRDAWMNKGYVLIKLDRYREAKECAEHILPSGSGRGRGGANRIPI